MRLAMSDATENPKVLRRLAAILAADIAGYSALMGDDEARTVRDLKDHLAVVLPMVTAHGGRVIDTAGDGILAEFASVVNAVECAVAMQKAMTMRNAEIEDGRRMQFRIGINIGDVIHDEARLYGDGVNVAARLEAAAEPGTICISGAVYEQVRNKLALNVTDLGLQSLKNITDPVRIYRITTEPYVTPAQAKPLLALPDKPSIAVLPFTNLSSHPEQEYLADGIVEDITTELSRISELFVIARNSSFQYKGKATDVRQVGRDLGVRYVMEGSVRRGGNRIRISAQLIDAATGAHRWAEHYDRTLEDVFVVQDEVVRTIVAILAAHVRQAEIERSRAKPPNSWQAYDYYLKAFDASNSFDRSFAVDNLYEARRLLQQSLAIDPSYARSYAALSRTYAAAWANPVDEDFLKPTVLERAHDLARKAAQLDRNLPQAHAALGIVLTFERQHDASIAAFEKAVSLNPNYVYWQFAFALIRAGDSKRAIEVIYAYMRLDPFYEPLTFFVLGVAHYMPEQYPQALSLLRDSVAQVPSFPGGHRLLAATLARMGHLEEARAVVAEVQRLEPSYTISGVARRLVSFKDPRDEQHFFDGLRMAGLPE
jgi:TolB-like protein/class 3 adenylate cyclase